MGIAEWQSCNPSMRDGACPYGQKLTLLTVPEFVLSGAYGHEEGHARQFSTAVCLQAYFPAGCVRLHGTVCNSCFVKASLRATHGTAQYAPLS